MIKLFFLPLADSESIVILIFDLSPIRKHVSLAMGLFLIGIKIFIIELKMRALSVMEDLMISFDDYMKFYEKFRFIQ
jgi:hypothetical protein